MHEPVHSILPYADIVKLRVQLRRGETLSSEARERFAATIVSPEDVILFKRLMAVGADPEVAGDAVFALFTRGGIGNLNCEIRAWLDTAGDEDTIFAESAPLVLAGCVKQLEDGTALRQLFEFSYKYDVKVVLDQVLADALLPLDRILRQSVTEQLDKLITDHGQMPSNRFLRTLRTYVHHEGVRAYLSACALGGRVAALASYAVSGKCLDWRVVDAAIPQNEFEMRLVVNVALDNIARGANRDGVTSRVFLSRLSTEAKSEFASGLSML